VKDELGMIRTQMGNTTDQKMVAVACDTIQYRPITVSTIGFLIIG
jgi:hypothetical protein